MHVYIQFSQFNLLKGQLSLLQLAVLLLHFIYTTFDVYPKWLKTFNIAPSSQAKQRNIAKQWPSEDLVVEDVPFTFDKSNNNKCFNIEYVLLPGHIIRMFKRESLRESLLSLILNHDRYTVYTSKYIPKKTHRKSECAFSKKYKCKK